MNRRETALAIALGVSAIGGVLYWLSGTAGEPERPTRSVEQAILDASRGKAGDADLGLLFDQLNGRHFSGTLPDTSVMWSTDLDRLDVGDYRLKGMTDGTIILLKASLKDDDADVRRTLCHEMVHVGLIAAGNRVTTHDALFQDELRRIFDDGCFLAILAPAEEQASLKQWIESERARLDAARLQVGAQGAAIEQGAGRIERTFAELNERIAAANAEGSGWPSRDEISKAERQRSESNDSIVAYNNAVANAAMDQARFNEAVERYNLMMAYPDGLAEDRAKGLVR